MKAVLLRRLAGRGAAALEFALITPAMSILLFGSVEVTQLSRVSMELGNTAQAMADTAARSALGTQPDFTDICAGGGLMMMPYAGSGLSAAIASISKSGTGITQNWQDTSCGSATAIANPTTLGAALVPNSGDRVIIVRATYTYHSPLSFVLPASATLSSTAYARPRDNVIAGGG